MKTYELIDNKVLKVYSNTGVHDFCRDTYETYEDFIHNACNDSEDYCEYCIQCPYYDKNVQIGLKCRASSAEQRYCRFNMPVIIDENVTDCSGMFSNLGAFNQPVIIPDGVTNCEEMFQYCYSFNQDISIPTTVKSCRKMFHYCYSFNSNVLIPDGVTNCIRMFFNCLTLNKPLNLPSSIDEYREMLYNIRDFSNVVFINKLSLPEPISETEKLMATNMYGLNGMLVISKSGLNEKAIPVLNSLIIYYKHTKLTILKNIIIIEPENYKPSNHTEDILDIYNVIKSKYPEDSTTLFDLLINMAISHEDTETVTELLDYKNKNDMYADTDNIERRFSLDDDDDTNNGETSFF